MLISTKLDLLGDLLHNTKVLSENIFLLYVSKRSQETMITKGVASVRSPVRNLQQYRQSVDHESFVCAAIASFQQEYNIHDQVRPCPIMKQVEKKIDSFI